LAQFADDQRFEVRMSGRRGYSRCGVANVGGRLKVARDVAVWRHAENEMLVVSDEPGTTGEVLTLERVVHGTPVTIEVCVIDSHPAIVNGTVRHRLRLRSNVDSDNGELLGTRTH
jgi:hypothetical protein